MDVSEQGAEEVSNRRMDKFG